VSGGAQLLVERAQKTHRGAGTQTIGRIRAGAVTEDDLGTHGLRTALRARVSTAAAPPASSARGLKMLLE